MVRVSQLARKKVGNRRAGDGGDFAASATNPSIRQGARGTPEGPSAKRSRRADH